MLCLDVGFEQPLKNTLNFFLYIIEENVRRILNKCIFDVLIENFFINVFCKYTEIDVYVLTYVLTNSVVIPMFLLLLFISSKYKSIFSF